MVGNDTGAAINASAVFGNAATPTAVTPSVAAVWTWNNALSQWNLFVPSMTPQELSTYATTKSYGVLSSIAKGEGFWVNAKTQFLYDPSVTTSLSSLTLSLPASSINASHLAVIVAAGDPISEAIASYYQSARGIPAANIIRVTLTTGVDTISATDFATLKAQIDAALPSNVQATLLTWTAPSRVAGSCAMGITSALALGFDPKYCSGGTCPGTTTASPYYDSESALPWVDHKLRPSMMLGTTTLAAAKVPKSRTQPWVSGSMALKLFSICC
jgi:hypothetical protein